MTVNYIVQARFRVFHNKARLSYCSSLPTSQGATRIEISFNERN
jgi:hypothetical protein